MTQSARSILHIILKNYSAHCSGVSKWKLLEDISVVWTQAQLKIDQKDDLQNSLW